MCRFLLFLVFLSSLTSSFAQGEIEVKVEIHVIEDDRFPYSNTGYRIEFFTGNDTFNLYPNDQGILKLSTKDSNSIIALNQDYHYMVYEGKRYFGQDKFNTNHTVNTKIIRKTTAAFNFEPISFQPIEFIGNTLHLSSQGKIDFELLSLLLKEEKHIVLEFHGQQNQQINGLLAVERANKIRDSLIYEGHEAYRLRVNKPVKTANKATCVEFGIIPFDYDPQKEKNVKLEEVYVDLKIIITRDTGYYKAPGTYQIELFSDRDTFNLTTNNQGVLELSTRDGLQIIKVNQHYNYNVYRNNRLISSDRFSTHVDGNTRIIRELSELRFPCQQTYDPISFIDSSVQFSERGQADFSHLSYFVHDAENMELEIYGNYNATISSDLAYKRSQKVRDSLIAEGVFADRLKLGKPQFNDTSNKVCYVILSFDYTPCTGGSVVNFDKTTDTIVETRCDSIHFIANYLKIEEENYAVIGIYTIKNNRVDKQKAYERAARVREKLIALGIDEKRLRVTTSYHKEPDLDDHRDWPFYPINYSYEIGVYVLGDY